MKKLINGREAEWIIEGARLKKLREDHQMSRAELARVMNTSDARLENGDGVRDANILSHFYEHIIKHQDLVEELEALYTDWNEIMKRYMVMEQYVLNDLREKSLTRNVKKSKSKGNKVDLNPTTGIRNQQKSLNTRFNSRNII